MRRICFSFSRGSLCSKEILARYTSDLARSATPVRRLYSTTVQEMTSIFHQFCRICLMLTDAILIFVRLVRWLRNVEESSACMVELMFRFMSGPIHSWGMLASPTYCTTLFIPSLLIVAVREICGTVRLEKHPHLEEFCFSYRYAKSFLILCAKRCFTVADLRCLR
jgi:hypothetical protein